MTLLLAGLLLASVTEKLETASNTGIPEADRLAVFEELATSASTHREELQRIAADSSSNPNHRWIAIRALGKSGLAESRPALEALCNKLPCKLAPF